MERMLLPAIWLVVLIVGLPQLSETVYTPSLPEIAKDLKTTEAMVEYTLTIYLFSFAIGTLFWGNLSDKFGRKPCILAGLIIFLVGCIGCYAADSITELMLSRFIQAFGGSIGSVLGQAICRDSFEGPALGKVYSSVGSALALFPAIGPILGGFISESYGWSNIFLVLIIFALLMISMVALRLPETHCKDSYKQNAITEIAMLLLKNKNVVLLGFLVAACNGISFSYFAEGSFYFINLLGLSASNYGITFLGIATSTMLGGIVSRQLQNKYSQDNILQLGILIILAASVLFSGLILLNNITPMKTSFLIAVTCALQMFIMFGICIVTSNALAMALKDFKWCIGAASSIFGFFYYLLISLFTFGMGILHDGSLLPMPLYFLSISSLMLVAKRSMA